MGSDIEAAPGRSALPWVRLAVGAGLLVILCRLVPLGEIAAQLRRAAPWPVAAAVVVSFAGILVSTLKLWLLVRATGGRPSFRGLLRAYYVGTFFNNFLPTSVGGDVVKVGEMRAQGLPLSNAAASVLVERGTGACTVLALSGAIALGWPGLLERLGLSFARVPLAAAVIGGLVLLALAYAFWLARLKPFLKARREGRLCARLYRAAESLYGFRNNPRAVAAACALSVVFYGLLAVNLVLLAGAVGGRLEPATAAGIVPLARLPEMVPVSVGALGVREGAITYCLARVDVTPVRAAAVALLLRLVVWVHSAAGGCVFAIRRREGPAGE